MKIASAASAFPKHYYSQKFLLEKLQEFWGDRLKNPRMLERLHQNVAVQGRYLAMPPERYNDLQTWGQANDVWVQVAQELGEQALCRALHHAGAVPLEEAGQGGGAGAAVYDADRGGRRDDAGVRVEGAVEGGGEREIAEDGARRGSV